MADKIGIGDVVNAGYCVAGARRWFRASGLDFRDFCRNGMTQEQLGDDEIVRRVFERKQERARGQVSKG